MLFIVTLISFFVKFCFCQRFHNKHVALKKPEIKEKDIFEKEEINYPRTGQVRWIRNRLSKEVLRI